MLPQVWGHLAPGTRPWEMPPALPARGLGGAEMSCPVGSAVPQASDTLAEWLFHCKVTTTGCQGTAAA